MQYVTGFRIYYTLLSFADNIVVIIINQIIHTF